MTVEVQVQRFLIAAGANEVLPMVVEAMTYEADRAFAFPGTWSCIPQVDGNEVLYGYLVRCECVTYTTNWAYEAGKE